MKRCIIHLVGAVAVVGCVDGASSGSESSGGSGDSGDAETRDAGMSDAGMGDEAGDGDVDTDGNGDTRGDGNGDTQGDSSGDTRGDGSSGGDGLCPTSGVYFETISIESEGRAYAQSFRLYVPPNLDPGAPLVMQLHGANGSIDGMLAVTGLEEAADVEGFIVVTPLGFELPTQQTAAIWNSGPPFSMVPVNHVDALSRVVEETARLTDCGQERPTFVAGQSNGAMMAYRLACEASEYFSGVIVSAGYLGNTSGGGAGGQPDVAFECDPVRPLPLLHIHGIQDPIVSYEGNPMTGQPAIEDNVAQWRVRYGCDEP